MSNSRAPTIGGGQHDIGQVFHGRAHSGCAMKMFNLIGAILARGDLVGEARPSECQTLKQNDHPESTQEQQVPQQVWQESNGRFASFPTDRIWTISYGAPYMTNIFGASGTTGAAGGALGAPRLHVGCIRHDGCHKRRDGCT